MRVLAVTSWGGACGIANFCEQLITAVQTADPTIEVVPSAEALDPQSHEVRSLIHDARSSGIDLVYLNYHKGLHSRWTPERVQELKEAGYPVMIEMHDTVGERLPDDLTQQLHDLADAFIVHEPCEGLPKQILIRQGVPAPASPPVYLTRKDGRPVGAHGGPVLGTCGFNFPWKNFDRLAEVAAVCGWGIVILSNNATHDDIARWERLNPDSACRYGFAPTQHLVQMLSGCDATCFAYECANSGTSGAIRLGLAARKPVIAWGGCRQFRDLMLAEVHPGARSPWGIRWCHRFADLPGVLSRVPIQRLDPGVVQLAHRDSWAVQGARYAAIFRECCP